jgi:hypothetical protein
MPMVIALALATLSSLVLCAPAAAQSPTLAELAMYSGADRTERLIAGAKKEGVLTIYSSVTTDDTGPDRGVRKEIRREMQFGARAPRAIPAAP